MADQTNRYDMSNFYRFRISQDSRTADISAFNGNVTLSIWDNTQRGGPIERISMTRELTKLLQTHCENILKAQPSTTLTLEQKIWERNSDGKGGTWTTGNIFKFIKDDKQTYAMEISTRKMSSPLKCIFKSGNFSVGTDELTEAEQSALGLKTFISFLDKEVPLMRALTTFNRVKPQFNNNRNSGGSHTPPPPSTEKANYTNNDEAPY